MKHVTGKPIKYIGVGEKISDFELFHPDRLANRILGMGDVVTLVEKAAQDLGEEKLKETINLFNNSKIKIFSDNSNVLCIEEKSQHCKDLKKQYSHYQEQYSDVS